MSTVPLGSAITNTIGTGAGEVRIGLLSQAGVLPQGNSIGALQDASFDLTTTSIDAKAGSPQRIVAKAITEQAYTLKGTTLERSIANLNAAIGNGVIYSPTNNETTLTSDELAGSVQFNVALATGIVAGTVLTIYPEGRPEQTSVVLVDSVASLAVTLNAGTPLLYDMPGATDTSTVYKVFVGNPVAGGKVTGKVNYFSATWIKESTSGRPFVYVFWKVAAKGNFSDAGSASEFSKVALEFDVLTPTASDVAVGGALHHVAALIAKYPAFMIVPGADL